jgi:hypothetical protein
MTRGRRIVNLVKILFGYAIMVAGLSIALFAPLFWLLTPDPTLRSEPRVAPVPPRIAASIERKRAPPPVQPERVVPTIEDAAVLPEMNEAPAALPSVAPPVEPVAKKRALSAPHPGPRKPRPPAERNARELTRAPTQPVSTARTDFPY